MKASASAVMIAMTIAGTMAGTTAGCTEPRGPLVVTNPDPSVKIPAIKLAVQRGDRSAAKQLVIDLENDDPAVRFYAIEGLRKITGEKFGYEFFQDEEERKPAVARWRAWLNHAEGLTPTSQP